MILSKDPGWIRSVDFNWCLTTGPHQIQLKTGLMKADQWRDFICMLTLAWSTSLLKTSLIPAADPYRHVASADSYNSENISKWIHRLNLLSVFSCWYLSPTPPQPPLYYLAADKPYVSYLSVLNHCQQEKRGDLVLYVIQFLSCQAQPLSHQLVLTSLGPCHVPHLPDS